MNFLAYCLRTVVFTSFDLNEGLSIFCAPTTHYRPHTCDDRRECFLRLAGIAAGAVRIAWRSAAPHLQSRGVVWSRRTASRMITAR